MFDVLIKSLTFVLIIVIGYTLKQKKILKKEDANILATIIMNVTLPCALLTSANGIEINQMIVVLIIIGIVTNVMMMSLGYFITRHENKVTRGAFMINSAGYNIGNFVLPFATSFYPGLGVVYLCAFDIGNALMCLGITYACASHVASGESHFDIKELFKKLFSSIPFDVYILIFILGLLKLQIPASLMTIASTIGAGNSFLAMLMIGIMLELKMSKREMKNILRILSLRVAGTFVLGTITYFVLPLPLLARQILVLCYCAPLSTVSPVFTKKIGFTGDMAATANSLSIIISVICMVGLLLVFI